MTGADLTNKPFGRLTARSLNEKRHKKQRVWRCECRCGKFVDVSAACLVSGNTQSCGCRKSDLTRERNTTHGLRNHPEYMLWHMLVRRVNDTKHLQRTYYGGRGIKVCERWTGQDGFKNFLEDMGPRPGPEYSVDRYPDKNGDYEPGNTRWATPKEQNRNRRSNREVTYKGVTKILVEWAEELGVEYSALLWRLDQGWAVERAFTQSYRRRR